MDVTTSNLKFSVPQNSDIQLCPKCGKSYYTIRNAISTTAYYPPIYKDGFNINPDRNETKVTCVCKNCGSEFNYT